MSTPLLSFIQHELPAASRPAPTRVCCGATPTGCAGNAWLFATSGPPLPPTRRIAADTTVFVSSSARPRDDGDANVRMLTDSLRSVRRELRLAGADSVLVFDGLDGKPSVSQGMTRRYALKIARALQRLPNTVALVCETWLHQANSLRCAMEHATRRRTPLVFVIQDDTQIGSGGIDSALIHRQLMHDPTVEYVRFSIHPDCADGRTHRVHQGYTPCTPHPSTTLLHRANRWLDRPHFATRRHYEQRLFATLPYDAKVTPEQVLDQHSRLAKDWPLWMYGARGDMARDLHWPTLVDGKLWVSKEFVAEYARTGHNVTSTYTHSYLIHAYRGKTQDVGGEQIAKQAFRTHNPNMWAKEDGLTKEDE